MDVYIESCQAERFIARTVMDLSNPTFVIGGLSESCSETVLKSFLNVWEALQKFDFRNIFPREVRENS